jgi:predicted O-methyltransferase YrrM
MLNDELITLPIHYEQVKSASEALQFNMLSDLKTGSLLRTLAASKGNGRFLELGTGTGLSLTWLAEGAGPSAEIISVDNSEVFQEVAAKVFRKDERIRFFCEDANQWLNNYKGVLFDLIFADTWPGKFENLDLALKLIKPGGFYLIDDLSPQPNWPAGHSHHVDMLLQKLNAQSNFVYTALSWSTGLMLFTRIS